MRRLFRVATFFLFLFFITTNRVFAQSNYVLPYPSIMPGGISYKIHLLYENVSKYWYFGDFGQFDYTLKRADKYLVEAKTLFEYKQYLLGYNALKKSDSYFVNIMHSLAKAERNGKNTLKKKAVLRKASQKHIEVLEKMELETPDTFIWQPEKALPTNLYLKRDIEKSIDIRRNNL